MAHTAEFLPGGLIPLIADDLGIDVGLVGQMVSVFAFTVVLTTAPLALVTGRIGRKTLVVASLALVSLSNVAVSAAASFEWILVARASGAIAHGLFWAVVVTYAVEIVPLDKLGRAMAYTGAGSSLAGVLGIPIGNALGEFLGWREAFLAVALAGAVTTLVLWRWLPPIDAQRRVPAAPHRPIVRARLLVRDRSLAVVVLLCLLILVLVLGQTSFGPYTTVWLGVVAGLDGGAIPAYLFIMGIAGAIGALAVGHLYDRFPRATFVLAGSMLTAAMCLFPTLAAEGFSPQLTAVAICASVSFAGMPMMLQARMMQTVPPAMRRVAGAVQTTVFNLAIGGGAVVGGLVLSGAGVQVLPWVAAGTAATTVVIAVVWESVRSRVPSRSRQ
ncbi:MFS transporter [Microbacteriaceae bacterium VKM Ac-2855]|nr:MFS transporter [Microbacteriaceae bacterium VKM Ac-2855]